MATRSAWPSRTALRRRANWQQLARFAAVGASGYVVNLAVFTAAATWLGAGHTLAAVLAFVVAVTNNLLWNCGWTFRVGAVNARAYAVRFLTISVAGLVLNVALLELFVRVLGVSEVAAQAAAVALVMPFNFLGNRLWTFRA